MEYNLHQEFLQSGQSFEELLCFYDDMIKRDVHTPLHHAAQCGSLRIVRNLIEMGEDINALFHNQTPLLLACGSLVNEFVDIILPSFSLESFYSLAPVSPYYHQYVVEYLLENGAKVNIRDGTGRTALDLSCQAGNFEMVKKLLDLGAKINRGDGFSSTLHHAVKGGNIDVVRLLLEKNVLVNYRPNKGGTVLEFAISEMWNHHSVCEIVESLLEKGARVNEEDRFITQETLLHFVCRKVASPIKLLSLLLKYRADINAIAVEGTPLNYVFDRCLFEAKVGNIQLFLCQIQKEKIRVILEHVSEMRKSHESISPENERLIESYHQMNAELVFLKTPLSELNGMSLWYIILKDMDLAGCILEDRSILEVVFRLIAEKLPLYGKTLKHKCLEAHSRRIIFLQARKVFYEKVSCYKIPLEMVEKCCQFLSTGDLKRLSDVVPFALRM